MAAREPFARFLEQQMLAGLGDETEKPWTGATLAEASKVKAASISQYLSRKNTPSADSIYKLERVFFPRGRAVPSALYARWRELRAALGLSGPAEEFDFHRRSYSPSDVWEILLRPIRPNVAPLIRDGGSLQGGGLLSLDHITMLAVPNEFYISPPPDIVEELRALSPAGDIYDLHEQTDLEGSTTLAGLYRSIPVDGVPDIIARHASTYGRQVLSDLKENPTYPPYNKKKLGIYSYQQPQYAGQEEASYVRLQFYRTDYFTHRVMRRVAKEILAKNPDLLPAERIVLDGRTSYLRYFLTSFGLNLVVTAHRSANAEGCPKFYMTRLSTQQGNTNQHNKLHISANEGLNESDIKGGTIDLQRYALRALSEELGILSSTEIHDMRFIEFGLETTNFEPFLSGWVQLKISHEQFLKRKRLLARDDHRETIAIIPYDFTFESICNMLFENGRGVGDFSTFALHILDTMMIRNLPWQG